MAMIVLILFALPALLYGVQWWLCWRAYRQARRSGSALRAHPPWLLEASALLLHAVALSWPWPPAGLWMGFAKVASATLWVGLVLLVVEARRSSVAVMRLLALPPTALAVVLPLVFPGSDVAHWAHRPWFGPHLIAGTLAYGVLSLAALHAWLMQWIERDLHRPRRRADSWRSDLVQQLPPLMSMERILFQLIALGFMLLLMTTVSGMVFAEEVQGYALRWQHKTLFGLIALVFFGVLLLGRVAWGWRGRIATRLTLGGSGLLWLAYVGTRFVLEVLLHRV